MMKARAAGLADQTTFWAPGPTDGLRLEGAEGTWSVSRPPPLRRLLLSAALTVVDGVAVMDSSS